MRFEPKTEKEIAEANLFPIGTYDFEVGAAVEGQSKAGNDMISLTNRVYNAEGGYRNVLDWLVSTDGGAFKIRHFAESVGLLREYDTGELRADMLVGRTGRCKIGIQKDKTGQYPDKNSVADYLPPTSAGNGASHASGGDPRPPAPPFDDEIPF